MSAKVIKENTHITVRVNADECGSIWSEIEPHIQTGPLGVILDFSDVSYLNSMNIAAIIALKNKTNKAQCNLALANLNQELKSTFRILKLERIFELSYTMEQAMTAVES